MSVNFHKLMKHKNPHFQETQWMTSRINAEKCVCLHRREAAENQRNPETTYMGIKRLSADISRTTEAQE